MILNAGPITVHYENGFLRTLSAGSRELLRMIYFAFRDPNWDTAPIRISNERIERQDDTFQIEYDWFVNDLEMQAQGYIRIKGESDGSIEVQFRAEALRTFQRNRVGLCILHPIVATTGQPCQITSPDGTQITSRFPEFISPHQPFLNIQTMTWETAFGDTLRLDFSGDVFETEDQRNWTDASFKTYSTPLTIPIPATVQTGTIIEQAVRFQPIKLADQTVSVVENRVDADVPTTKLRIGLGHRIDGLLLLGEEARRLKKLDLSHLRADVFFAHPKWSDYLENAWLDAQLLNVPLELALFFEKGTKNQLPDFLAFLSTESISVQSLSLFNSINQTTSDTLLTEVVPFFRDTLPDIRIGGGTNANFAEFNRNPFRYDLVDFVTFSANPQAHAIDDQTIMENATAHFDVVRSAKKLAGDKPVHVSPITLLPRFNPALPANRFGYTPLTDERQNTKFAAEWTRISLQMLRKAGAESVTYFETHGPRGVLNNEALMAVLADR
ncbi:hypothetical protein IC229_00145 [Spirosoma sp. BT702]|uniref:Uncharacterized protein n=1 Tax=Spirosoma profusum TaxID=2771354 RepID=A0A927AT14_9BACT|nr:hypothetical protein [Spirosoma profusum]MBD2699027.1 hypothetical protein [Spirosoma profusum]